MKHRNSQVPKTPNSQNPTKFPKNQKIMKKLITLLLFITTISVSAQKFEGGLFIGMTASQIEIDFIGGYHKVGLVGGPYVNVFLKDWFAIQSGLSYIGKGAHSGPKSPDYFKTQLDYIEVPALMNFYIIKNIPLTAGATFGYLFRGYNDKDGRISKQDELNLRNLDLSSYIGINYMIGDNFSFTLAHSYSIIPITKPFTISDIRNIIFRDRYPLPCWWNNVVRLSFQYRIIWR